MSTINAFVNLCIYASAVFGSSNHLWSRSSEPETIINLGSRLELFVDSFLVESMINARLAMHKPVDKGPVIFFNKPWEGVFSGYTTIIKDSNLYRMYYRGIPTAGSDGSDAEVTCYAESPDGINWIKPDLGLYEVQGSRNNNIILAHAVRQLIIFHHLSIKSFKD
jgi:hypothetical protein